MILKIFLTLLFLHGLVLNASSSSSSSEEEDGGSSEKDSGEHHPKGVPHGGHWGYEDQAAWSSEFSHCSGKSQSPIDIDTRRALYDRSLPPITLEDYDLTDSSALTLLNNGHTLQLVLPNTMRITSGFDNEFRAAQLHFHWGTKEVPGSEHTIDNVHFPAEIHIVHYNSKYANLSEAASKSDGLAVLGGFIGIGLHENDNYEKILSALADVSIEESNTEIPAFNVRHLLPNKLERFYRYNGSLTTPPCFQTVNWTMFNDTITVSRRQLAALEDTLKAGQHQHLTKNFRAPQLLHGRHVLASFTDTPTIVVAGHPSISINTLSETDASNSEGPSTGPSEVLARGDILAIAFGALFAVTLLLFTLYAYQQRKKYSSIKKDSRQNVIYKPATKEEA
ncbi:carbonic anhydrase 14 isoform X1 [Oncorhynchus mykiss]|uniref:carbonic anhydrase 2 n=1 Tax=Oncorhynchus clarkii lewisi TaxID=490388 RepID=UPI0018788A38|nr:carbonic anhydrase 14 isoform X1 [Oncorhynchus mykiss]